MTQTQNQNEVESAYQRVADHADTIQNDAGHNMAGMEVGDCWRQGDVQIRRLPNNWVTRHHAIVVAAKPSIQLAPGSTQGSRHCLDSLDGVHFLRLANGTPLDGPILALDAPRSITHPEHGDCEKLPPGCYGITYQRAFAEELRRVED